MVSQVLPFYLEKLRGTIEPRTARHDTTTISSYNPTGCASPRSPAHHPAHLICQWPFEKIASWALILLAGSNSHPRPSPSGFFPGGRCRLTKKKACSKTLHHQEFFGFVALVFLPIGNQPTAGVYPAIDRLPLVSIKHLMDT